MINDNLISQLKIFIRKHYEMVEEPVRKKPKFFPSILTRKKVTPRMVNYHHRSGNSFEELTETLAGFIKDKRKSETFSILLEQLRVEKGLTAAELYNGAWIKKQLYSKIMGERNYHPSKNTVIAFGLSLRLNQEGMEKLLESAGYRFNNSSIADLVVLFCLSQSLYDLHDVNALLLSADQKVLCRE
jgi:hypothetical protein